VSLRARLLLLIVGMVATLSLVLLAIQINTLVSVWLNHSAERAASTSQFVKTYVTERATERAAAAVAAGQPSPTTLADRVALWRTVITSDNELPELLNASLAQTRSIVEIAVAGERGRILACSNPAKAGSNISIRLPLRALLDLGPLDRFLQVLGGQVDYENRVELGVPGQKEPVFTIQVLVSSVLLRDAILPELQRTAWAFLPLFILAILISWVSAQLAMRPLAGISQTIDRISRGESGNPEHPAQFSSRELATVQEKLRMLGEQFRGAQMGATQWRGSVERLLARLEEAIFLFDSNARVIVCGEAVERLLRLRRADIAGMSMNELFPDNLPVGAALAAAVSSRRQLSEALVGRLILNLDFLPDGAMLLRMRDAEGRQIVENQLNLSSRLAAINRLTGGVAHEIKNPLNSIALRLELLRSRVLPEVPEAAGELEVISQEITRLDRVVRTFLDFTRPVEVRTTELDFARIVTELVELVRPEFEQQSVQIETTGMDLAAPLRGDADLLKQALMNIMRNALEAMPNGGVLRVALRVENDETILDITDTGPGIPPEARERIFQLYYTTKQKGSGIGLAMTFRAVQLHNGGIEVGGEAGKGTTFRMRLPLAAGGLA
jgi:signal transduction histidine kinase